jgi:WD40 repeat protein
MIWEILRTQIDEEAKLDGVSGTKDAGVQWSGECTGDVLHDSQVWRVEWNSCGSMLAAGIDDGHVRIYARDGHGGWRREQ